MIKGYRKKGDLREVSFVAWKGPVARGLIFTKTQVGLEKKTIEQKNVQQVT
jgi:hypothetical protein